MESDMTTIKEIVIQSIGEPYSVKIERNSKGYNYEVGVHAEYGTETDGIPGAVELALVMRKKIEEELGISARTEPV